ncbi:MAG: hypothetical protein ACR2MM_08985 [Flavobacteriaceae bacterium]
MTIKKILVWIGLSITMMVLWIVGLMIGNAIFPSSLMDMETGNDSTGILWLLLASALNAWIILKLIYNSEFTSWKLVGYVFLVSFGIQYFMSQIETIWFNDSLQLPINGIWAIICGGAVTLLLFAIAATGFTRKFKQSSSIGPGKLMLKPLLKKIIVLSVIIWPLIYFMFGYLVAWQFAEVRMLYSGTTEMDSFISIMKGNLVSGLYAFQILRGFLWVLIGILVIQMTNCSRVKTGILLGLLFTILGSSGLLIPNPIMPEMVRMAHLIETSTSDFLWGFIIAWYLWQPKSNAFKESVVK